MDLASHSNVNDERPLRLETLQAKVVQRALADEAFRAALLADPRRAIRDHLGIEFTPALTLKVIEQDPNCMVLVIPGRPAEELSDDLLDAVSGGAGARRLSLGDLGIE